MGRLTDGMTRLVAEIQTVRRERERSMRDLAQATVALTREVAHLRSTFAADVAGARAAWRRSTAHLAADEVQKTRKTKGRTPARRAHETVHRSVEP